MKLLLIFFFFVFSSICFAEKNWTWCSDFPVVQLKGSGVTIPSFYFWRRVYLSKGKDVFKPVLVEPDGTMTPETLPGEYIDGKEASYAADGSAVSVNTSKLDVSMGAVSSDGVWEVKAFNTYQDDVNKTPTNFRQEGWYFQVQNLKTSESVTCNGGPFGFGPGGYCHWDDRKDICYVSVTSGSSTNRAYDLVLIDPHDQSFKRVCNTNGRVFFNHDETWLIWESGRWLGQLGNKSVWIRNLFAFNSKLKKNFIIAEGTQLDVFNRWK